MAALDLIAFLTDYGQRDGFPAACHGVFARLAPHARVLDVSHEVPAYDVRHGAAVLARVAPYLPPAVYVGVVDPGVGTTRRGIVLRAGDSLLVGPDNGLLLPAARTLGGPRAAHALENEELFLAARAATFDGRDVFAPVAARLATGIPPGAAGPPVPLDHLVDLPAPFRAAEESGLSYEVTYVDGFGNVQLAGTLGDLAGLGPDGDGWVLRVGDRGWPVAVGRAFAAVGEGTLLVYDDSDGRLAIAVNTGSAAALLGIRPGDRVRLVHDTGEEKGRPADGQG